jgi:hypothetical protein
MNGRAGGGLKTSHNIISILDVITLNDRLYRQFAESLLSIAPGFPMNADDIEVLVREQGLDSFINIADRYDEGISEIIDLLIHPGNGGILHEPG